ncbi:MAG TPA: NADH-quinone oxidoreductase subunit M [Opitutaceae bacterium]|nr:NADH-quinone oxidoreductase subunit M [Opitutaceae bacterium]
MKNPPLLSLLIFAPFIGAALLALLRNVSPGGSRAISLLSSLSTLVLAFLALGSFDRAATGYQFVERHDWIAALNVHYHLGLDGMSLLLVLLTGIVSPAALLAGWKERRSPRLFGALFLVLQGAALGVFLALDFFHWFLFWELSLVPAYFLIKLWGGPGATRAAYQFVIYTLGGSAFMLLGFAALFAATGTLDFTQLAQLAADGTLASRLATTGGFWPQAVFLGLLLGLAVKVPLFPFHTWLPAAYAEAPTGVSMFLTGVMSKMGVYAFFRILWPIFPGQLHAAAPVLIWLALGGVVLGGFAAMKQTDLKRMVAYSSINHLSYCLLALFAIAAATGRPGNTSEAAAAALSGALLQMFNHGLSAAALFLCIGVLESRSGGSRGLDDFGGVRSVAPVFAGLCGIAMFSSIGLPGLNGFVGEFLIFRGVFGFAPWAAAIACLGLFATAFFYLTFWQRVFHGPRAGAAAGEWRDVGGAERATLLPLAALMILFGVMPHLLTGLFNPLITSWANHLTLP